MPQFFFFNDTATTEIYTLSLHDALPISRFSAVSGSGDSQAGIATVRRDHGAAEPRQSGNPPDGCNRSEEHTSELQSRPHLVCRLLLEKEKQSRLAYTQ